MPPKLFYNVVITTFDYSNFSNQIINREVIAAFFNLSDAARFIKEDNHLSVELNPRYINGVPEEALILLDGMINDVNAREFEQPTPSVARKLKN